MGYNKFIVYGDNFELYEYEKNITFNGRPKGKTKTRDDLPNMALDGATTLPERQLGKRPDSARRASLAFRRVVASNLGGTERPLLVTLTYAENITEIRQGYKDFKSFIDALRYQFGKDFKYIAVPEFQKRGAVHFHALFWGLPARVFTEERHTRFLAKLWKVGFVYLKETDGNEKLSHYLSKYMAKAFMDVRLKNHKAYVCSRNVLRPYSGAGFSPVWPILDSYVGDAPAVLDRQYETHWLGKGRYRLFKIEVGK